MLCAAVTCHGATFVNGNFETGDLTGWTQGGGWWYGGWPIDPAAYLPGGASYDKTAITNTVVEAATDPNTDNKLNSVYSGKYSLRINDSNNNYSVSVVSQTVTGYTDPHIYFAWAAVLEASHGATDSDNFILQLTDVTTGEVLYDVAYNSAIAATAPLFTESTSGWYYTSWQVEDLDVSKRTGHTFTLTLLASDCPYGGHAGYVYLDGFGAVAPPSGASGGALTTTSLDLGTFAAGSAVTGGLSATGGTPPYTWAAVGAVPAGITVDGNGNISGAARQTGNFSFIVTVTDAAGSSVAATVSFSVFGLSVGMLPSAVQYSPYLDTLTTTGGTPPFVFSAAGLPPGLTMAASGVISGICAITGTWNVTIGVTDANDFKASGVYTLTVIAPPPLVISQNSLTNGTVSSVYSTVLTATGGAPPYTWSVISGAVPDGLAFKPSGTISGVPAKVGTFSFGVRVTDVTGGSATAIVGLTIAPIPLSVFTPSPLATGVVGVGYPAQTFTASGGTPPYAFSVAAGTLPGGLTLNANGVLSGIPSAQYAGTLTLTVTDAAGLTGTAYPALTVVPYSIDLALSSGSLRFDLVYGSTALPPAQTVAVQSTAVNVGLRFTAAVAPSTVNWLTVSGGSATPGTLSVSLTPEAHLLAAADTPYTAAVTVTCTGASPCAGYSKTIMVALNVTIMPPMLSILKDQLSFTSLNAAALAPSLMSQTLGLANTGGGSVGIGSISCHAVWCTVSGIPGFLAAGPPTGVHVNVDATGMSNGFYRTTIDLTTSAGSASVPVTLFISPEGGMTLQPAGKQFQSLAGGVPAGSSTSFLVDVAGNAPVNFTAAVMPGANWLTLQTTAGSATGTAPANVAFSIDPAASAALAPGIYFGTIRLTAPGIVNAPQDFRVVLDVGPANGLPQPSPSPEGLLFITTANTPPPSQVVTIASHSPFAAGWQASATANGAWLSIDAATGIANPLHASQSVVSVDPSGLAAGIYTGSIAYAFAGVSVRTVNVALIVTAPVQPAASGRFGANDVTSSCVPTQIAAAVMSPAGNFALAAGLPVPLSIRAVNNCGDPVTSATLSAVFSNGDLELPLTLADPATGLYSATWIPQTVAPQANITITASAAALTPAVVAIAGSVMPAKAPLIDRSGTLQVYNPQPGAALAPGTLVTIKGAALAAKALGATTVPLGTTLGGTSVTIGGIPAPLLSVSPGLVMAQVPFAVIAGRQYQVVVTADGASSMPDTLQVVDVAPALGSGASGYAATLHMNGTVVDDDSPAKPGESLLTCATGLGMTDIPVPDGNPGPTAPAASAVFAPALTLNGQPASVSFAGLMPGMVGMYQINFVVPPNTPDGDMPLVITQNGVAGNVTLLPVMH